LPHLEAEEAVIHGKIVRDFRMPFHRDLSYKTIIIPGFSDTHAHPQVIDAGLESGVGLWRNSYHWIETRKLRVDEASLRADIGLSARLAELALKRAVLEGTTLIAFTGRLEANLKARLRFSSGPRLVLLPTLMDRKGWARPSDVEALYKRYSKYISDSMLQPGVFVHSIRYTRKETFMRALEMASHGRMPLGLHLSEGAPEDDVLTRLLSESTVKPKPKIVAVHCLSGDPRKLGIRCSSCPGTNALLYAKARASLGGVTSFGSDWPHLIGTMPRHLGLITKLYGRSIEAVLKRATLGGYNDYNVAYRGDLVAYDVPLEEVLTGKPTPRLVMVANNIVVDEGRIVETQETLDDIVVDTLETIRYATEVHGNGEMPKVPGPELIWEIASKARRLIIRGDGSKLTHDILFE